MKRTPEQKAQRLVELLKSFSQNPQSVLAFSRIWVERQQYGKRVPSSQYGGKRNTVRGKVVYAVMMEYISIPGSRTVVGKFDNKGNWLRWLPDQS